METIEDSAPTLSTMHLESRGVVAQLYKDQGKISIFNRDGSELFSFPATTCPFVAEPIQFLVDIYKAGFERGKSIGREVTKMRFRDLLSSEL